MSERNKLAALARAREGSEQALLQVFLRFAASQDSASFSNLQVRVRDRGRGGEEERRSQGEKHAEPKRGN